MRIVAVRHLDGSCSEAKPLIQYYNRHAPLPRVRLLRFLNFFKDALLLNFKIVLAREMLVLGVQQVEKVFSVVKYEFACLLNGFCLGITM
jgi:hypothetical protein